MWIRLKLTAKTPERRQVLTLNIFHILFYCFCCWLELVNPGWETDRGMTQVHLKSCQIFIREIFCKNSKRLSAANPLNANPTKWSNTLKQFVGNLPTNCLSVLDHFVGLALKRLSIPAKTIYSKFVTGFQTLRAHVQRTKSVDN